MKNYFDAVYVLNLHRRSDRWAAFHAGLPADWPFRAPQRIQAVDGSKLPTPAFWTAGQGAWGCYRSHVHILETAISAGHDRVLILEDDAVFVPQFAAQAKAFLSHVPQRWDMLYLGGQHFRQDHGRPSRVNDYVCQPFNVLRTHAFALSLADGFGDALYDWLHRWNDWRPYHHVDHHMARLHENPEFRVYCPHEWLVGQRERRFDISDYLYEDACYWSKVEPSHTHWRDPLTGSASPETIQQLAREYDLPVGSAA